MDDKWKLVWHVVNQGSAGEDLSGKDLSGADLRGANLSGANLAQTNLSNASIDATTLMDDKWKLVWHIVTVGEQART